MKRVSLVTIVSLLSFHITSSSASAFDVGEPAFGADIGNNARIEFVYEKFKRDIKLTSFTVRVPGVVEERVPSETLKVEADAYIARLTIRMGDRAALFIEGGLLEFDEYDDSWQAGGGFRYALVQAEHYDVSMFLAGRYAGDAKYKERGVDPLLGPYEFTETDKVYEAGGGFLVSSKVALDQHIAVRPYAGILLSVMRGEVEAKQTFDLFADVIEVDADVEEDGLVSLVAGLALLFGDSGGIRVEGRFIDQSSVSVGAWLAF